jgi:gamma-glutamyltranspeptidase/glutathione hydrolase
MVASVHPLATEAGLAVLKQGGNAIDAAVAVGLTLGVVDGANSGIGGGCFFLIRLADGTFVALDGRETAPSAATRDMFVRDGKGDPKLSQTGALASGVPGALAAYNYVAGHYGRKPLKDLLLPAASLADKGFHLSAAYVGRLKQVERDLGRFPASRAVYFKQGHLLSKGELLRQPDLAATYRAIAAGGIDWFYRGPFAAATEKWMKENGGLLSTKDFADYRVRLREPIHTTYRGYEIISFPPPSSGGVHVAQVLNILENFQIGSLDPATRLHVMAEAMKLAFADRAYWLGDPDFVKVPRGLLDKDYARELASKINLDHAIPTPTHGTPADAETNVFGKHTTHFSVADDQGNWVACTATINTSFGSKVVIPGTGVMMNDEMDDFSIQPGVTNFFGLVGGEANAVAPGKRPLSSLSPTIVLKGAQPMIALGAAGGPKIITQVIVELVGMLDLGLGPGAALAQPRIHHQWAPDELQVEQGMPLPLAEALSARGHKVTVPVGTGVSQIVSRSRDGKSFVGAADPRAEGTAAGW